MVEPKDLGFDEIEMDIEAIIQKESDDALERFRRGDLTALRKARLDPPLAKRPFFLLGKPVFVTALGVLTLAVTVLFLGRGPGPGNGRVEAGFRSITEALKKTDFFRAGEPVLSPNGRDQVAGGWDARSFALALFGSAARSDPGTESIVPEERNAPLRPVFSPNQRFKILFGDQVILRVLTNIASQKEA
jgi:hypothetical protein